MKEELKKAGRLEQYVKSKIEKSPSITDLKYVHDFSYEELDAYEYDEEDRVKTAIPILEKVLKEYWNLSSIDKNRLLKTIIERVEYTKTKRKSVKDEVDNNFELKIFLKI